ncbi:thiamine ABC transporter substrate-binding protein [Caldilinea sp.]|uniref:thiamine ABC transporter substrate-binding protein n=1 Tax=Caldilinea sp. TaxID=2293560 RepID=UPI002B817125|nr:thiamine ABC transporter substrate-binding protein [Caldilinea sp.]HRA65713.1 thiamine ABC transporter substrate-binding protein [Caldilinea sp.]
MQGQRRDYKTARGEGRGARISVGGGKLSLLAGVVMAVMLLAACQAVTPARPSAQQAPATLVLATHDSFAIGEEVLAAFEAQHNVQVQVLTLGDAGEALNKIILSKDAPLADLFFGVDNTFLSRALAADVFDPYVSPQLAQIQDELKLDPASRLLPVDYGFVNLNADAAWFEAAAIPLPRTLEDLTDPIYQGLFVAPNPASSSPGLAFLLATIDYFGEDGYLDFWRALKANDVLVTDGWSEAYFEHFTVGSGGAGDRPLVVSYSTSPPADVVYATDERTAPASINLLLPGSAFRQVEFVGVLAGAAQPELAREFIDFMLGEQFQSDIPLQMFVYPANPNVALPDLFTQFAQAPSDPVLFDPAAIEANRERWVQAWADVMTR